MPEMRDKQFGRIHEIPERTLKTFGHLYEKPETAAKREARKRKAKAKAVPTQDLLIDDEGLPVTLPED